MRYGWRLIPGLILIAIAVGATLIHAYMGAAPFFFAFAVWWLLQYLMLVKYSHCGSRLTLARCPFAGTEMQLADRKAAEIFCLKCGTTGLPLSHMFSKPT